MNSVGVQCETWLVFIHSSTYFSFIKRPLMSQERKRRGSDQHPFHIFTEGPVIFYLFIFFKFSYNNT